MLATHSHSDFTAADLLAAKSGPISVVIPAKRVAETIGPTVESLTGLLDSGLVDQLLVVDADSDDGTAERAAAAGAEVVSESELMPAFGECRGKGDAMWRSLSAAGGEIVVFADGDVADFGRHYVIGTLGPILTGSGASLVKGFFRRPFNTGLMETPSGGGRVTELVAKPLLALTAPELSGFEQPLAGELAARRSILEAIPFYTGYGVETAMLLDAYALLGIEGMAQVDLGSKRNAHQPLEALALMSAEVIEALSSSLERLDRPELGTLLGAGGTERNLQVRPPYATVRQATSTPDPSP